MLIVRKLRADDIQSAEIFIEDVLKETFEANDIWHMQALLKSEIDSKKALFRSTLALCTDNEKRIVLLAVDGHQIVGSVSITNPNDDITSVKEAECQNIHEVGSLFVAPDRRGCGLGAVLWLAAVMQFQKSGETLLCFDSGYPFAQQTWQKRFGKPQFELIDRWGEGTRHMIWKLSVENALSCITEWLSMKKPYSYQSSLSELHD
ncbi:GNAT family N-acetyltransferase [Fusibacter paucivorans]|uniref:GNAT family N-acetyltransferase n=1 Tax=Fusibacter paucivorans TaxID=76009 RepID=A0ABS5PLV7_9FIRM|nr:GNAT family N-acetyltransferase [Fusibacter paucivorans]MBS7525912.1 GNAT family N-acetyltransferase [Fusibacter paucivorans]